MNLSKFSSIAAHRNSQFDDDNAISVLKIIDKDASIINGELMKVIKI